MAALAVLITTAWQSPAHADGGSSSARIQTADTAPEDGGATAQTHAQRILRALTDRDANNWVRYWQARHACAALDRAAPAAPLDRALLTLTAPICAKLEARLGVNPFDYPPPDEDRTVGLLLNEPGMAMGYTLVTGYVNSDVFLLDPLGRVAHAWHLKTPFKHAKLLDNGNLLVEKMSGSGILEFDPRGNKIWEYKISIHHDFLKMPNGNVMMIAVGRKTREEVIAAGANPEFVHQDGLGYDYLLEVRPTSAIGGEVVWQWSTWDHLVQDFDPTKPNYGAIAEHPERIDLNFLLQTISELRQYAPQDWLHTNSIDYNPALDQIMLSPRHFSELWIIDRSATTQEARGHTGGNGGMGGDLLYRWGNPRAYGRGDADDQRLFWQHQTHWIPSGLPGAGNILLFNNGMELPGDKRRYSSIDELVPPALGYRYRRADNAAYPPDALEWTYAAQPPADFYAPSMSGTQRLPNGNTLIVDGTAGTIFQATPCGRIVWKYVAPLDNRIHLRQGERPSSGARFSSLRGGHVHLLNNGVYRAYWHSPDHPGLQALDLVPGAFIEDTPDIYAIAHSAAIAGDFGDPLARSDFDIYLDESAYEYGRRLIYIKQPCAATDARHKIFLHIIPARPRDLPADKQERGFENLDFNSNGNEVKVSDDRCVALRGLPGYPIEGIHTGQFMDDAGQLWRAEIELGE